MYGDPKHDGTAHSETKGAPLLFEGTSECDLTCKSSFDIRYGKELGGNFDVTFESISEESCVPYVINHYLLNVHTAPHGDIFIIERSDPSLL